MGSSRHRSRSPAYRRRRSRSLSPRERGATGGSRRDYEAGRRDNRGSGLRDDYKGQDGKGSNGSNERGNRDERKSDSGLQKREDVTFRKIRLEDARKPTRETPDPRSPQLASSAKEANTTRVSHSRRSSEATEEGRLRAPSSLMKLSEQTDSPRVNTSHGPLAPSIPSNTSNKPIYGDMDRVSTVPLQQVPLPRSTSNVDAELQPRHISEEEANLINGIWGRRVDTLAKLQDLLMKKDDLFLFLKDAKSIQSAHQDGSGQFQGLIERLEAQIQKADVLITDLWRELVDDELNLIQTFGRTSTEHERLDNAEKAILAMEQQVIRPPKDGSPVGGKETEGRSESREIPNPAERSDTSESLDLEDLRIDDLEDQLRERQAELQGLEFGFNTEEFRSMVYNGLEKLKRHGRIGSLLGPALTIEEEKLVDELGVKLAVVESWATDYENRVSRREEGESEWAAQYKQTLGKIESASNAVIQGENLLRQAETRLKNAKLTHVSIKDEEVKAQKLADQTFTELCVQVEEHWRQILDTTRLETRGTINTSLRDFQVFLGGVDEEERATWQESERMIFEEVAQKLEKTFKWQDAVVKWLEKEKKIRVMTV